MKQVWTVVGVVLALLLLIAPLSASDGALTLSADGTNFIRWAAPNNPNAGTLNTYHSEWGDVLHVVANQAVTTRRGTVIVGGESETHPTTLEVVGDNELGSWVKISSGGELRGLFVGIDGESPELSDGPGIDVEGKLLRLRQSKTPASAGDVCKQGEIGWNAEYLFVCVGENQWKRSRLRSW